MRLKCTWEELVEKQFRARALWLWTELRAAGGNVTELAKKMRVNRTSLHRTLRSHGVSADVRIRTTRHGNQGNAAWRSLQ